MQFRPYQNKLDTDIYTAWGNGYKNVAAIAPTGAGKSVILSKVVSDEKGYSCTAVHRKELVSQLSCALAKQGVYHCIIAPDDVVRKIISKHVEEFGRSYHVATSKALVASVPTLVKRGKQLRHVLIQCKLWVMDECHHVLKENVWGKCVEMMPNARGLGVTATPSRADGKGLGSWSDGVFDTMVFAPTGRELIEMGYLCDYKIYAPPSDLDLSDVTITASGDYSQKKLAQKTKQSHIVGDVVQHYLKLAAGKRGITFVPTVEIATETAMRFKECGVRAEVVHAGTEATLRDTIIKRFAKGELDQLVNVDLFGEGFDVPAVEVVSMARATASFGLFSQQFGRALRPVYAQGVPLDTPEQRKYAMAVSLKPHAIIIDHVGNTLRHGLPDAYRKWTLNARDKRGSRGVDPNIIKMKACPECTGAYEAYYVACPYCGHKPVPAGRSEPKQVEGDLIELSPDVLKRMRGELDKVDQDPVKAMGRLSYAAPTEGAARAMIKRHVERQRVQTELRTSMGVWGGYQSVKGLDDRQIQRKFFHSFGVDVMTAQTLGVNDANKLKEIIDESIQTM